MEPRRRRGQEVKQTFIIDIDYRFWTWLPPLDSCILEKVSFKIVVVRDIPSIILISPGGLNSSYWNFPLHGCISFFYTFECFSSLCIFELYFILYYYILLHSKLNYFEIFQTTTPTNKANKERMERGGFCQAKAPAQQAVRGTLGAQISPRSGKLA